jgi:hypothetical protein
MLLEAETLVQRSRVQEKKGFTHTLFETERVGH